MKKRTLATALRVSLVAVPLLTLCFTGCSTREVGNHFRKRGDQAEGFGRKVGRSAVDLHESHVRWWKRTTN